jgi:uncharacterized protein (TIGR02118 family)
MIKVIGLLRRNPQLTQEEFVRYWKTVHVPLVQKRLAGLVKYTGAFPIEVPSAPETAPRYDGLVELGFETVASMQAAMSSALFLDDERKASSARLMDLTRTDTLVMEEIAIEL